MMNSNNYLLKKKSLLKLKKLSDFKGDFESSESDDSSNIFDGRLLHEETSADAGPSDVPRSAQRQDHRSPEQTTQDAKKKQRSPKTN